MTLEQQVHQNDVKLQKAESKIKQLEYNIKQIVDFLNDTGITLSSKGIIILKEEDECDATESDLY